MNEVYMKQFTKEQAIALADGGEWKEWTDEEVVNVQLFQDRLCMPFVRFHQAMESVLGRPVFTHEFAYPDLLIKEYLKEKLPPTFDEICNLIPKEKLVVIGF